MWSTTETAGKPSEQVASMLIRYVVRIAMDGYNQLQGLGIIRLA